jgi:putative nucleotidyltransferase with HDIG domain
LPGFAVNLLPAAAADFYLNMTQTIVITSGKGGVGKTNISVNMAIELARRDFRTCLFDADLGLANVNILLGIDPEYTLDDYIFGDKSLDEIILETKFGIDVIPGSSGIEKMANLEREEITNLVAAFSQIKGYDFFLIDTSSGISRGVIAFCLASNETIIVITSEATSLTDAYAVLKVMALNNYPGTVKILVNKRPSIPQAKQTFLRFKEVVNRHLEIDIAPAGIILNDPNIEISVTKQEPALILFPDTAASQCIRAVVSNLIMDGAKNPEEEDFGEFWQRYFEHSLLDATEIADTTLPNKPVDRNIPEPCQPDNPAENTSTTKPLILPPEAQPQVLPVAPDILPIASGMDQENIAGDHKSRDIILEAIAPFTQHDGIFEVSNLASPTPLLSKSLELLARDEITEEILLDIFSCDPILMVKALKMICRPKTDTRRATRITTKRQLIEELGTVVLTNILSTTAMQRALCSEKTPDNTCCLASSFWSHSYQTALLAQNIAEITGYLFPEEAFIAGLIHDIGRLALQTDHPEVYTQSCYNFQHDETLLEIERRIFKNNHAEIGAKALRAWHLDSFLVDAVQYHTEPLCKIETAFSLVKIISLACRLSHSQECRKKENETAQLGIALFNLSASQLKDLAVNADGKTRQLAERFRIPFIKEKETYTVEKTETYFRQQVMEYSILQGMLPCASSDEEISEVIKAIFLAFDVLFNFRPSFCLMPDDQQATLKAIEYPNCFGRELLAGIRFSLKWEQSMVVKSFHSGKLESVVEGNNGNELPIADHQLLRSLGTEGFVCLPMIAHKINRGMIVFGIKTTELAKISSLQNRLEQFAAQAARKFVD